MSIKKLREQHTALTAEARSILNEENITEERSQQFDKLMADADKLAEQISRYEKLSEQEARTAHEIAVTAEKYSKSEDEVRDDQEAYDKAFRDYMRFGMEGVGPQYRSILSRGHSQVDTRAQSVTGGSPVGLYGGYTVATEFLRELERALLAFGGMLNLGRTIVTATGGDLQIPYSDDTSNVGAILGENQPITEQDVPFGQLTLGDYKYTSKLIRVSWELMQDSAFNMESFVAEVAGERLGRILNTHLTTGNGTSQPQGVVTGSVAGVTGSASTGITYNDLVDLQHSVDPAYRANARFMFNDSTLKVLRKLKDSNGLPLWQPDMAGGIAGSILGQPYVINQDMASIALSAKSVLYGDFSYYLIRRISDFKLIRLNERYADNLQTGFFIFARYDAKLRNAGTNPIKHLVHPAASP